MPEYKPSARSQAALHRVLRASNDENAHIPWWAYVGTEPTRRQREDWDDTRLKRGSKVFPNLTGGKEANRRGGGASAAYYYWREGYENFWNQNYDALFAECMKGTSERSIPDRTNCGCEDDNRNIPCDSTVHERTFGPVSPSWPGVELFRDQVKGREGIFENVDLAIDRKNLWVNFPRLKKTKESLESIDADVRRYIGEGGPMPATAWRGRPGESVHHVPSAADLRGRRIVEKDAMDLGSKNLTRHGGTNWTQEREAKTARGLVREYISDDASGLKQAIQNWVSKFVCEPTASLPCPQAYPTVLGQAADQGGGGASDASFTEGADNWYVSEVADLPALYGNGVHPVGCVRAKFVCWGYFPVRIPDDLPEDPEIVERSRELDPALRHDDDASGDRR